MSESEKADLGLLCCAFKLMLLLCEEVAELGVPPEEGDAEFREQLVRQRVVCWAQHRTHDEVCVVHEAVETLFCLVY